MKKLLLILLFCLTTSAFGQFFASYQKPSLGLQVNGGHPVSRGLDSLWLFNEGSGRQVFDLSGNGGIGIFTFSAVGPPTWTSGKFGHALVFTGNFAKQVACTNLPPIGPHLTVLVWFKINTWVDYAGLVDAGFAANFLLRFDNTGKLQFYIVGSNINSNRADFESATGIWHQVVATYNGAVKSIYVNGIYDNSSAESDTLGGGTVYDIGTYNTNTEYFGLIDHVIVWNRALSAWEIALLYREPFCFMEPSWDWVLYGGLAAPAVGAPQVIFIN